MKMLCALSFLASRQYPRKGLVPLAIVCVRAR
jgi:hypothetical protein